jgi:glycogen(starch) synthase
MRILLATDAFPPICGGSGWSTYELARGLRAQGHDVSIVQPRPATSRAVRERSYDDFQVIEYGTAAPPIPYLRNYFKNERLFAELADFLTAFIKRERIDVVHGQHVMTSVPAVRSAHRSAIPAVCTVRDYWPVCYWSDLIHTPEGMTLCPRCSASMMTQCVRPHAHSAWPLALPMIPYMRANLARKQRGLGQADAIVAVSSAIAADLRARSADIASARMEIIPNAVNVDALQKAAAASAPPMSGPYALYLGKLAPNKGTTHLVRTIERAHLDWPLVVAGDGPERATIEKDAARSSREIRFVGWVDQPSATAWMAHASLLVFPSRGPESLSRVLIEASALGLPIAAMNTGGTPDIVINQRTGLLANTPEGLADDIRRLRSDESLRARLGSDARAHARATFDTSIVIPQIERLYIDLMEKGR